MKTLWKKDEVEFLIKEFPHKTRQEIAKHFGRSVDAIGAKAKRLGILKVEDMSSFPALQRKAENKTWKKRYEETILLVRELEKEKDAYTQIKGKIETFKINEVSSGQDSESTVIALVSDWHYEETVKASSTNNLNKYDTTIADARLNYLFQRIGKFVKLHQKETEIRTMVLALLGDFISGSIHDDLMESNSLSPIEAIWKVQNILASGIKYLLDNTNVKLVIPCCCGNHSRITEKQRVNTETGNSLEWLMYLNLEQYFKNNKRVKFIINDGYINYLDIYSYKVRFHHGHAIKYNGGIGGIFIPVFKAISQWNKAIRADYDFFGHYHQFKNGGNFISNGSVIGYNAFAIKIKADYEKPQQGFILLDKKRGIICVRPIILNGNT